MRKGFSTLGVRFDVPDNSPEPRQPVETRNPPAQKYSVVASKSIHDRVSFDKPPKNRNRSLSKSRTVYQQIAPVQQRGRSVARKRPANPCIFCNRTNCPSSTNCGLSIKWSERIKLLREIKACRTMTCLKIHEGICTKFERNKMRCSYCNSRHHIVFCQELGEIQEDRIAKCVSQPSTKQAPAVKQACEDALNRAKEIKAKSSSS